MFHSSRRNNYALESLDLWLQHDFSLSPRLAAELIWGRFVNVQGLPGRNIPNDLHMEHLNRLLKTSLQGLGANKTEKAIIKSSKVLGVIDPVWQILIVIILLRMFQGVIKQQMQRKTCN